MDRLPGAQKINSIQAVGATARSGARSADVVLIVGADITDAYIREIEQRCKAQRLLLTVVGSSATRLQQSDLDEMFAKGTIGPDTHIIVTGHGSRSDPDAQRSHHYMLGKRNTGAGHWDTAHLVETLMRQRPPPHPGQNPGRGMVHIIACGGKHLFADFQSTPPTWTNGHCLIHGGKNSVWSATAAPNIHTIVTLLGSYKSQQRGAPDAHTVFTALCQMSGEPLTLIGGVNEPAKTYKPSAYPEHAAFQLLIEGSVQADLERTLQAQDDAKLKSHHRDSETDASSLTKNTTLLTRAILSDKLAKLQLLISDCPSAIDHRDSHGRSPLMIAAAHNKSASVRALIAANANISAADRNGETALHYACNDANNNDVISALIDAGADVNCHTFSGATPLLRACSPCNQATVKLLLACHANPNIADSAGRTPLSVAIEANIGGLVVDLLHYNADASQTDSNGDNALHHACHQNNDEIVEILLTKADINIDKRNNDGLACLHIATNNSNPGLVQELLARRADPNVVDSLGNSPLHIACTLGLDDIATLLLKYRDTKVDEKNKFGVTPLAVACKRGNSVLVETLLRRGALVATSDSDSRTPLMCACVSGDNKTVKLLLDAGSDVNRQTYSGITPIMYACQHGGLKMVQTLLKHGADPNLFVTDDGKSALDFLTTRLTQTQARIEALEEEDAESTAGGNATSAEGDSADQDGAVVEGDSDAFAEESAERTSESSGSNSEYALLQADLDELEAMRLALADRG